MNRTINYYLISFVILVGAGWIYALRSATAPTGVQECTRQCFEHAAAGTSTTQQNVVMTLYNACLMACSPAADSKDAQIKNLQEALAKAGVELSKTRAEAPTIVDPASPAPKVEPKK